MFNVLMFIEPLMEWVGLGNSSFTSIVAIIGLLVFVIFIACMGIELLFTIAGGLLVLVIPTCTISSIKQCQNEKESAPLHSKYRL